MAGSVEGLVWLLGNAWTYFIDPAHLPAPGEPEHDALNLQWLYGTAADYNPLHTAAKQALAGDALDEAMVAVMTALHGAPVVKQEGNPWQVIDPDTVAAFFVQPFADRDEKQALASRYYHVYPAGTAFDAQADPTNAREPVNWRVGLNVAPAEIAPLLARLLPVMEHCPAIQHLKLLAPGSVAKADSILFYMNRNETYDQVLVDIQGAVTAANVTLVDQFSAIYDIVAPGVGGGAEPPEHAAASFTSYRSLVIYLAFVLYFMDAVRRGARLADLTRADFVNVAAALLPRFGIPVDEPFKQNAIDQVDVELLLNDTYFRYLEIDMNEPPGAFEGATLW